MGAPRLLDRKVVNAEVATQKLQQVKEGINLAKKVDALRETVGEEELRLEKFRQESVARVQIEIDAKIAERESLIRGNEKLNEDRLRLQAPIDLQEEWSKVRADKSENEVWQSRLIEQQVSALAREADNQTLSSALLERDSHLKERENLVERTLVGAEEKYELASNELDKAEKKSQAILARATNKEKDVLIREQEVSEWNDSLMKLEGELKEKDVDLTNRERALTDKYETFMRAQRYINNK